MSKSTGRPVNPRSERSLKPWRALKMSRASYYWRKRYGGLPMKYRAAKDFRRSAVHKLLVDDVRYIKRFQMERPYREHKWLLLDFDIDRATLSDILHERTHRDVQP
jgi:hypothetical protein